MLYDLSAERPDTMPGDEAMGLIKLLALKTIQPPGIAPATHFALVVHYLQNAVRSK